MTKTAEHEARCVCLRRGDASALLLGITNRSSLRHAPRLSSSSSFVRPHGRTDGRRGPSVQPGTTAVDRRPRVRSGPAAAAAALLQIITRDFLTISAVRPRWRRPRVRCWRVPRTERKGAAARDHRHHLLNGKKRTWPQSIRTKQRSCRFWPYGRQAYPSVHLVFI